MTPYVTNKPQIDYPDGQSAQDFSLGMDNYIIYMCDDVLYLGVEKDVSWMAIPAGIDTRKHGWRDVVSLMDRIRIPSLLLIYKQAGYLYSSHCKCEIIHFDWPYSGQWLLMCTQPTLHWLYHCSLIVCCVAFCTQNIIIL